MLTPHTPGPVFLDTFQRKPVAWGDQEQGAKMFIAALSVITKKKKKERN